MWTFCPKINYKSIIYLQLLQIKSQDIVSVLCLLNVYFSTNMLLHVIMFGDDQLYDWSLTSISFTEYAAKVHILYDHRLEYF